MRIYASNNEHFDFCLDCAPSEEEAIEEFGNLGDGPDERGNCFEYDGDHPPYSLWDYFCYNCGEMLIELPSSYWAILGERIT